LTGIPPIHQHSTRFYPQLTNQGSIPNALRPALRYELLTPYHGTKAIKGT
jgi:hypothetical protein